MRFRNPRLPYDSKLRQRSRELRKNGTLGEVLLWLAIKRKALGVQFYRQVPVGEYILDFFCYERMLAIEIDGSSHEHESVFFHDIHRQAVLEAKGIRFLRFRESRVRSDREGVVAEIKVWLDDNG